MKFDPSGDLNFQLESILNEGIEFGDNIRGALLEITTEDGEQEIEHGLGYKPIGWIVLYKDGEVDLWAGSQQWTNDLLYLKSSAPNRTVRLFVV